VIFIFRTPNDWRIPAGNLSMGLPCDNITPAKDVHWLRKNPSSWHRNLRSCILSFLYSSVRQIAGSNKETHTTTSDSCMIEILVPSIRTNEPFRRIHLRWKSVTVPWYRIVQTYLDEATGRRIYHTMAIQ
jgi:hypothetical protein